MHLLRLYLAGCLVLDTTSLQAPQQHQPVHLQQQRTKRDDGQHKGKCCIGQLIATSSQAFVMRMNTQL